MRGGGAWSKQRWGVLSIPGHLRTSREGSKQLRRGLKLQRVLSIANGSEHPERFRECERDPSHRGGTGIEHPERFEHPQGPRASPAHGTASLPPSAAQTRLFPARNRG